MDIQDDKVKTYFKVKSKEFDEIYDNDGGFVKLIANKLFRKGMHKRFKLTMAACMELKDSKKIQSILDVGCGAGRFAFPLEEMGLEFKGVDYSSEMIDMANSYLGAYEKKIGRKTKIKFEVSDFMKDFPDNKKYDVSLAIGVFDYVSSPALFIKKIKKVTKTAMILSFPKKITPQMPIRKTWLLLRKCPVYFYTLTDIRKIMAEAGISKYSIDDVPAGYHLFADVSSP